MKNLDKLTTEVLDSKISLEWEVQKDRGTANELGSLRGCVAAHEQALVALDVLKSGERAEDVLSFIDNVVSHYKSYKIDNQIEVEANPCEYRLWASIAHYEAAIDVLLGYKLKIYDLVA